jgi:hypothetical protein
MARTLAAVTAALVAALTLTNAQAEPQAGASAAVGQPLNIIPSLGQHRKPGHAIEQPAAAKTAQHMALQQVTLQHMAHRRAVHTAGAVSRSHDGRAVLRGQDTSGDTSGLLAMLPWWRPDPMETIRYLDREAGSGVLAAAEAWLAAPMTEGHVAATGQAVQHPSSDDINEFDLADVGFADPDELNAMDLLAVAVTEPRKPDNAWLHALLAMLGGALAAASTARFLFG